MTVQRDNFDALCGLLGGVADLVAAYVGVMLAVWIRFDWGVIPLLHDQLPPRGMYVAAAGVMAPLLVIIFRLIGLYRRPQVGRFEHMAPRLTRGVGTMVLIAVVVSFLYRRPGWPPYSRTVAAIAFFTVWLVVMAERYVLSRLELHWARHSAPVKKVLIIGTGGLAVKLRKAIEREPRLRARVVGHVAVPGEGVDGELSREAVLGEVASFEAVAGHLEPAEVMLATERRLGRERLTELILHCERRMMAFRMVPDLVDVLTDHVRIQHVGNLPLLGLDSWPLDAFHNRVLKRAEDVVGAVVGLVLSAPVILVMAPLIKASSPGPIFYRQKRVGANGRRFTMYKLRSMPVDAEAGTGPVWAQADDARRTKVGEFLRRWNLDELPQFWNVLKGDMSLVGPRPERPFFVERFKNEVDHYMTRHVVRPGMTGWAQVNGLRGNTSLRDRIQHDIYYLENWSLSLDFKILVQTFFCRENAY